MDGLAQGRQGHEQYAAAQQSRLAQPLRRAEERAQRARPLSEGSSPRNLYVMSAVYDSIGHAYADRRRTDSRIAALVEAALGNSHSVLNVGAGSGSYESPRRAVTAIEPSRTMIRQRPVGTFPTIQARAEALPIRSAAFDAVMGILTLHHWSDLRVGIAECRRVARERVVLLTVDMEVCARFWLYEYFPDMLVMDRAIFPSMDQITDLLGSAEIRPVPVPADCQDGFLCAYWKRPEAYLDPMLRAGISSFAKCGAIEEALRKLRHDIESGEWIRRNAPLLDLDALDLGYRLLVASP
jgi:SAM-dependent methyltransferase